MTHQKDRASDVRAKKSPDDPNNAFSQEAAKNRKPADDYGNTEPLDDVNEKTRHSDGQNPVGSTTENFDIHGDGLRKRRAERTHPAESSIGASRKHNRTAKRS